MPDDAPRMSPPSGKPLREFKHPLATVAYYDGGTLPGPERARILASNPGGA